MRRIARQLGVLSSVVLALGVLGAPAAAQTTHQVDLQSITFEPDTLNIAVGVHVQCAARDIQIAGSGKHTGNIVCAA